MSAIVLAITASGASGYTVVGTTFLPDHGAPGDAIVVEGLPLAVDCPVVVVWLAPGAEPSPPITANNDSRLLKVAGTTTHPPIGAGGVGDTRPGTRFSFRVPEIPTGTYAAYSQCPGGNPEFGGFGPGAATFTVDPALPGTDTTATMTGGDSSLRAFPIVVGVLAVPILLLPLGRRPSRTQAHL